MRKKISLIVALILLLTPATGVEAGKHSKPSKKIHRTVTIKKKTYDNQIEKIKNLENRITALEQVILQILVSSSQGLEEDEEDEEKECSDEKKEMSDSVAHMYL